LNAKPEWPLGSSKELVSLDALDAEHLFSVAEEPVRMTVDALAAPGALKIFAVIVVRVTSL
jgi:hypothetical protein